MDKDKAIFKDCVECGNQFIITVSEQRFYTRKLLDNPKRCHACREMRKGIHQNTPRSLQGVSNG